MLNVPESCPKIALICQTPMICLKWRIWLEKCLMLIRIKNLKDGSLAKNILEEGDMNDWPGLSQEVQLICQEIGIPDINCTEVAKTDIKEAIFYNHYNMMKMKLEESKKLHDIKDENFTQVQNYFNGKSVENGRLSFRIRCQMVDKTPGNFSSKYKREALAKGLQQEEGLVCNKCKDAVMSQSHCLVCPGLREMREGLDIMEMADMVTFFWKLMKERTDTERKGRTAGS